MREHFNETKLRPELANILPYTLMTVDKTEAHIITTPDEHFAFCKENSLNPTRVMQGIFEKRKFRAKLFKPCDPFEYAYIVTKNRQEGYSGFIPGSGTLDECMARAKELLFYTQIELSEAILELPKPWLKEKKTFNKEAFLTELADVMLMIMAATAHMGIDYADLVQCMHNKLSLNASRLDHKRKRQDTVLAKTHARLSKYGAIAIKHKEYGAVLLADSQCMLDFCAQTALPLSSLTKLIKGTNKSSKGFELVT